jgi:3'-5' exoribonuclease 1
MMTSVAVDLNGLQESFQNLSCHPNAANTISSQAPASNIEKKTLEKPSNQPFHSFLCIDFESTCINADDPTLNNPTQLSKDQLTWLYPNEIIEWPVILLQWRTAQDGNWELYEAGRYRRFVRPVWRPILSQFCIDLTGISQVRQSSPVIQILLNLRFFWKSAHETVS